MRPTRLLLRLVPALAVGCAQDGAPPTPTPAPVPPAAAAAPTPTGLRALPGALATAVDDGRGVPRFLWAGGPAAPHLTSREAARGHVAQHAAHYRLPPAGLDTLAPVAVHDPGRGGVIVTLRQHLHGVEVYRGDVKVLMRRDHGLVAIAGSPWPPLATAPAFPTDAAGGVAHALAAHAGAAVAPDDLQATALGEGGYRRVALARPVPTAAGPLLFGRPARVKPVLAPVDGALTPAWFVELFVGPAAAPSRDAFRYVIAADDGRVLERRDLTVDAAFSYRVWAETNGRPLDGPTADYTPHPTGLPDGSAPAFFPSSVVTVDGLNRNPYGLPDPWLAAGATQTAGNNVDAYADQTAPDGYSNGELRATTTAAAVFDRFYDPSLAPLASQDQTMAAVTQLFFTTNWLHDWYYDSGFDEAAGNAQRDNYGRGGLGGDPLHAEAQDNALGGSRNNANMQTPADGEPPRLQVYLWTGPEARSLTVTPGGTYATDSAAFGLVNFSVTANVVLANDGSTALPGGTVTDGCEPIVNNVAGRIVLIDRGACTFVVKAANAQAAGAVGVLIADNVLSAAPPGLGGADPSLTIAVLSVMQADGTAMKAALMSGPVTATMFRFVAAERDGALDATVVAHEYGHLLHHRLADCGQQQCRGLSEGYGDFSALLMMVREGDDLTGAFGLAGYAAVASSPDVGYYGLRRAPYSADPARNPFTFTHIQDGVSLPTGAPLAPGPALSSEVHNAGEIWAMMLFEGYVALLEETTGPTPARTFAETRRLMTDLLVASLKLSPPDATYTEARDALLAAAAARDPAVMQTLAAAFAARGAGACAESPPRASTDLVGVVESATAQPRVAVGAPRLDDRPGTCDGDGVLDVNETGTLTVAVANAGPVTLSGATLTMSTTTAGVSFPAGATVTLPALAPFGSTTATLTVALDASVPPRQLADFIVTVAAVDACAASTAATAVLRVNYDDVAAASATDDVESSVTTWTPGGTAPAAVWGRVETAAGAHAWHGADLGRQSDTWLASPPLTVAATGNLVLSFRHRHDFEADTVYWDGGVLELSRDGGATWSDVATLADPGYGGTLTNTSGNPLADRQAFVALNPSWPAFDAVSLDLGAGLAGETIQIRFRIGTDAAAGLSGWDLDDIGFTGIVGTPFHTLVDQPPVVCPTAPIARAGADQQVAGGSQVVLDASASSDANGDPLTFRWTQTAGAPVVLSGAQAALAAFTAPAVTGATTLTFQVEVGDGRFGAADTVDVVVVIPAAQCVIDGATYATGAADPVNECRACAPAASQVAWTPRAARTPCTDDGLACTDDACDGAGACVHALARGCLIAGACVAAGAVDPQNECRECRPERGTDGYSAKPAGVACTGDGLGYTADRCDGAGACVHPATGTCVIAGATYAAGAANPANECEACDPIALPGAWTSRVAGTPCQDDGLATTRDVCDGAGACTHPATGSCVIGGVAYAGGAANPANECEACDPTAPGAWTSRVAGFPCGDDGLAYTLDVCDGAGACTHRASGSCVIGGVNYVGGALNPASECEACDPAADPAAWSARLAGVACTDDGLGCTTDACDGAGSCAHRVTTGCLVGGACIATGAGDGRDACLWCDPAGATDALTHKATPECLSPTPPIDVGCSSCTAAATGAAPSWLLPLGLLAGAILGRRRAGRRR